MRDHSPWFDSNVREARKKRRLAERRWRRLKTTELRVRYFQAKNEVNRLIRATKKKYYNTKIMEAGPNTKKLYSFFNNLLGKVESKKLPEGFPDQRLSQRFADYFEEKINNITVLTHQL